jgi:hypothetical protein
MILEAVSSLETSLRMSREPTNHFTHQLLCSKTAGTADSFGNDPVQVLVTSSNPQTRRL